MSEIDTADHRSLQGHRPGDDRPDRRPGGHDVRPDDEHHRTRSRPARSRPTPSPPGRASPRCRMSRQPPNRDCELDVAVWHGLYAPKGTPEGGRGPARRSLQGALKDETVKHRLAELGTAPVAEDQATPDALKAKVEARDRPLEAGDRGGRPVRRLTRARTRRRAMTAGTARPVIPEQCLRTREAGAGIRPNGCRRESRSQAKACGAIFIALGCASAGPRARWARRCAWGRRFSRWSSAGLLIVLGAAIVATGSSAQAATPIGPSRGAAWCSSCAPVVFGLTIARLGLAVARSLFVISPSPASHVPSLAVMLALGG